MSLTAPSRRGGDLEASLKINIEASGMQTNKPNCVTTSFTGTPMWRNKRRVVEIHSSLVVLLLKFWKQTGGVRLDFLLGHISQEAPSQPEEGNGQTKVYCFRLS